MITLIIAGNYNQAQFYARSQRLHPKEWRYVSRVDDLRGRRPDMVTGGKVLLYGTYWHQRDFRELLEVAKERGLGIETVTDKPSQPDAGDN